MDVNVNVNPAIRKLPFDPLNVIFLLSMPSPPKPAHLIQPWLRNQCLSLAEAFFPVTLAAVCRDWRFVAFSTPQLWTYFVFSESLWSRKRPPCHIISLFLRNSRTLPIHLSFSFKKQGCRPPEGVLFHRLLDRDLISNLNRIQSLSLCHPTLRW